MLNPVRTEASAFRLAVGSALLAGVAALVALLTEPLYGGLVFAGGAAGWLAFLLTTRNPEHAQPLRDAMGSPHPDAPQAKHSVLVVANEALAGDELRGEIMRRIELWPELYVIAPVLSSRLHFWASDFDHELAEARRRLETTLAWAGGQGFDARGEISDPDDPLASLEDALRRVGADEVIVATHPREHANWLEVGILERLREELDVRLTHVVVDAEHHLVELRQSQ
jgi:GABA permease